MNNATNNAATEILCRLDSATNQPVLFFPNSIDRGQILAWAQGREEVTTLAYYHTTQPLSAADEEVLRQRYMSATGDKVVKIRHRLPRVPRPRENLLSSMATVNEPLPAPVQQATPVAVAPVPVPVAAPFVIPAAVPHVSTKRSRKSAIRRAAAMPVESQPLPPAPAVEPGLTPAAPAPSVSQATPGDVMAAIQALGEDFNAKLANLMATLTPANKN
jgi:hypothetical protein